jgi:hypothetical protein
LTTIVTAPEENLRLILKILRIDKKKCVSGFEAVRKMAMKDRLPKLATPFNSDTGNVSDKSNNSIISVSINSSVQ